ncbi:MAG: hypothetical protein LBN33_08030, partial [Desulfovibrio sp.]|nr:hypothetical protein [Desulfovibrio sp.]
AADLRVLRNFVPLLGARFYHIVPRTQGLPAGVESSGEIPDLIDVPADLPFEALCALLIAPLVWQKSLRIDLSALSTAVRDSALAKTVPLFQATGASVVRHENLLEYEPRAISLQRCPDLPLDPTLSAFILVLPAFTGGGSVRLEGKWPKNTPEADMTEGILHFAGLDLECDASGISARAVENSSVQPLSSPDLCPELGPLFLTLCAKHLLSAQTATLAENFVFFPCTDEDTALAGEFFSRLGLYFAPAYLGKIAKTASPQAGQEPGSSAADFIREEGALRASGGTEDVKLSTPDKDIVQTFAWTSPNAYWGMAFALAAFLRPGLLLANPGNVTEKYPVFWSIYNSLPNPEIRLTRPVEKTTVNGGRPARRRLFAD